jgi:hypothetical protein
MDVAAFADLEEEFIKRVHTMVWCSAATVDSRGRPRSRILHPIWEGATGWIGTHRNSYKHKHLARNPYMSLAYVIDMMKPVYVDVVAAWEDDLAEKQRVWALFRDTPRRLAMTRPSTLFATITRTTDCSSWRRGGSRWSRFRRRRTTRGRGSGGRQ